MGLLPMLKTGLFCAYTLHVCAVSRAWLFACVRMESSYIDLVSSDDSDEDSEAEDEIELIRSSGTGNRVDQSAIRDDQEEGEEDLGSEIEFVCSIGNEDSLTAENEPAAGDEYEMRRLLETQHAFCEHRDACRRWVLAYLEGGRDLADPTSMWMAARKTTWRCMECFDAYLELKEELFSDSIYRERHANRIEAFDTHRVVSTLENCLSCIANRALGDDDAQDMSYCCYEVLKDVTLLLRNSQTYRL